MGQHQQNYYAQLKVAELTLSIKSAKYEWFNKIDMCLFNKSPL